MSLPAKICGLTRPQDVEAALRSGASYLGMIFAGGPRQVTREQARTLVQAAGGQVPVCGVFSSQTLGEILEVRDVTGLTGVQLHHAPAPALVEALRKEGLLVLVVARLESPADLPRLDPFLPLGAPILVEPKVAGKLGGTGTALSHDLARRARAHLTGHTMFLAGGLTPDSVADAVRAVRPDAVDVSSGVEQIPGIKDHDRLARFLEVLRWL